VVKLEPKGLRLGLSLKRLQADPLMETLDQVIKTNRIHLILFDMQNKTVCLQNKTVCLSAPPPNRLPS
jgi:hypothetical protein